jgi:hypothetical protein
MMEPCSEWMVHFICGSVSSHLLHGTQVSTHLDIGEIRLHNAIHDTPHIGDGVLVLDANLQLVADE